ncbi:MAG: ABC transporter ATP-binding protein [Myxococcota bacterium]
MKIELSGLGKTYDGTAWAVRDMDLEIPAGAIFGLIGPNGAGKSTALRMVATVMDPTVGEIRYDGESSPDRQDPAAGDLRRRIGFLGDGNPLYKAMTPAEYLRFFGQCFGMPDATLDQAIEQTLTTFDLLSKADTPTGALSKGMRQRLLIARCLLHDPSLLILDEPADGLDPRGRADLRTILKRVRDGGVTVIISSHILRELDDLCDNVAILQKGRVVVGGSVDSITERYDVARFSYALRILEGADRAPAVLARHRVLIEGQSRSEGLPTLDIRIPGSDTPGAASGDEKMADLLADLIAAGVRVVTASRAKSRLEDVYDRLSDDRVN